MAWRFEFYQIGPDGKPTDGAQVTDMSPSIAAAILQAQSMMRDATFSFGKASVCIIKTHDGSVIYELTAKTNTADP